eukprot:91685-Ditylum_brightwellii.AAC.1
MQVDMKKSIKEGTDQLEAAKKAARMMAKNMEKYGKVIKDKMPTIEGDNIPNLNGSEIDDGMPIIGSDICNDTLSEGGAKKKCMGTKKRITKRRRKAQQNVYPLILLWYYINHSSANVYVHTVEQ